jgi:uncharacterized protein
MRVNFNNIKLKYLIIAGIALSALFIIISTVIENSFDNYSNEIINARKQKDAYFKTSESSPIESKGSFNGLSYFAPNAEYRFRAKLIPLSDSTDLYITRTDGKREKYRRYGIATFKFQNKKYSVTLLQHTNHGEKENPVLFLPFSDKTNGEETYEGGRYLDVEITDPKKVVIDFNLAYNPYCVYSYKYSCPLPPIENHLDFKVEAGEKNFKIH